MIALLLLMAFEINTSDFSLQQLGENGNTPVNPAIQTSIYLLFKLLSECASHSPVLFVPFMEPFLGNCSL
jgi:hypothetical protein